MFMVGSISGWEIVTRSAPSGKWKFVPSMASSCHALGSVRMRDCNAQVQDALEKNLYGVQANSGLERFRLGLLKIRCEEGDCPLPRIGGIGGAISIFVVWIFKRVPGVIVDFDFDFLADLVESRAEFLHVLRRDAAILCAE